MSSNKNIEPPRTVFLSFCSFYIEPPYTKNITPNSIYDIYKDALYIHVFSLNKININDLQYQYAIIVYRRNSAYLSTHKKMFLQKMPISAENTQIGVFYDKKNDILNNFRPSKKSIGLNIVKNISHVDRFEWYKFCSLFVVIVPFASIFSFEYKK